MRRRFMILPAALLLLLMPLMPGRPAHANGVPIRIPLTYLSGLSNWGPADASGEAEISFAEAIVKIDAHGLPVLHGETYQVWLVKSGTNKAVAAGTFTAAADGTAAFTGRLTGLDGYDYDLVSITVEPVPDPDPAPSAKRSIGGFFAPIAKQNQQADAITPDTQPATLPNTGDVVPAHGGTSHHTAAALLFGVGGLSLYLTARRRRKSL